MANFSYEVKEKIAVLSTDKKGNRKELRLVSFNGNDAKYDIRTWYDEDGTEKMGKGITLSKEEVLKLANELSKIKGE